MKKVTILLLLLLFAKISHAACSKPIIKYRENGQKINVYQCSFSGIHHIKVTNLKAGYSFICELNHRRAVFVWQHVGKWGHLHSLNAVTDSVGTKYIGYHKFTCDKATADTIYRLKISPIEIELMQKAIKISTFSDAKRYDYDLTRILFFACTANGG